MTDTRIVKATFDLTFEGDMNIMLRLNHDGTVDRCDDTPDVTYHGPKYQRSKIREGKWIHLYRESHGAMNREYLDDSEVPPIIKMFDLLEQ